MKNLMILLILLLVLGSCEKPKNDAVIQGKTEKEEIAVTGKLGGRIEQIWVEEGDSVRKGDTLAILDIPEVDAKRAQALGALKSASAQYDMSVTGASENELKQLKAKKSALQEQYDYAKKSMERLESMVEDSLVPQQKFDETYAKYQGALSKLNAVKAEIADVKNGVRNEKQAMALGQKNQALGALKEVNVNEKERFVLAPGDMAVENITLKPGELALPGYTLFKGPMPNSTYFRFTLPEKKLDRVEKGQKVKVNLLYADREIDGVITSIKKLEAYADIATAYPDYEVQQSLFEIKVTPQTPEEVNDIIAHSTVTLKL